MCRQRREIDELLDSSFFLPSASKPAHRQLKDAARRLVTTYTEEYEDDLHRVWETERPFELHLDGVTVTGRADVILDQEGGVPTALAIVDYKTATHGEIEDYALQLQVYSDAGRREGLDVRAAYIHDLKAASRDRSRWSPTAISRAEAVVAEAAIRIRAATTCPTPASDAGAARCGPSAPPPGAEGSALAGAVRRRRPSSPRRRSR